MDPTNRTIIDNFDGQADPPYFDARLAPGVFEDGVPGFNGLVYSAAGESLVTTFHVPTWIPASDDPLNPDILTIKIAPYVDISSFTSDSEEALYFSDFGRSYTLEVSNPGLTVPFSIPKSARPAGVYIMSYVVVGDGTLNNQSLSKPQLYIYDNKGPYNKKIPPAPQPPFPLPVPFDRDYFARQPNQTVPFLLAYDLKEGRAEGDYVQLKFGLSDFPAPFDPPNPEMDFKLPNDPAVPASIPLSLKLIQAETDLNYRFSYRVCDVAGNCSEWSNAYRLTQVGVAPLPIDLLAPTVELAADAVTKDGRINRADIAQVGGMNVGIPGYTNFQRSGPTDNINIRLETIHAVVDLAPIPLGTNGFPLKASATVAELDRLYGSAKGDLRMTVSWSVERGGVIFPSLLSTTINLDKSVVGPPPKDDTDVNTDLNPLVVNSIRPNGVFGPDNHLQIADANLPARARVPLWTLATTPQNSLPFTVTFVYGALSFSQLVQTIPASGFIDFDLSSADIISQGGPAVTTYYALTTDGSTNPQRPALTTVIVDSVFKRLAAPVIRNTSGTRNSIVCASFVPASTGVLKVFIPPSPHLRAGSLLTLTFDGFSNNTNAAPIAVTHTQTYSVPATAVASGFEVDFGSFATLLKPVQPNRALASVGSATIRCSVQLPGEVVSSDDAIHRLSGVRVGSTAPLYCDSTTVPV